MKESTPALTFGQDLVGAKFNPSQDNEVDIVKQKLADVIDIIKNSTPEGTHLSYKENLVRGDAYNCLSHASMAAVKFLTLKYNK